MKGLRIYFLLIFVFLSLLFKGQDKIPSDFCLFQNEYELVNLINDYRATFNKPQLNLSNSLCYVAYIHNMDLINNLPDTSDCMMNSWSDKGNWIPCCYNKSSEDKSCIHNKPMEFTEFPGEGYELVFWDSKQANAKDAFDLWRSVTYSRSMLLNEDQWSEDNWKSIGVSVKESYAIVWLSIYEDVENYTKICNSDQIVAYHKTLVDTNDFIIEIPTGRFYIITASFANIEEAITSREKLINSGFKNAKLILNDNRARVSLDEFLSREDAGLRVKELSALFPDIWVLKY